jgi:excisionase family DNA binding protein
MNVNDGRIAKEVMDIRGVAAYLGLGKSKIYGLIRERKIPASRIGRQYRFSKELIDAWLRDSVITRPDGDPPAAEGAPSTSSETGGTVDRR